MTRSNLPYLAMIQNDPNDWQAIEPDPTLYQSARRGWTKNWRSKWMHPSFKGRTNHIAVFDWLVSNAVYDGGTDYQAKVRFQGKNMTLMPGQVTCGMHQVSKDTGVKPSTVHRVINDLVNEGQIEKQTDNKCSLITIKKWGQYQGNENQNEKQKEKPINYERKTDGERVRTKEESKEIKSMKEASLEKINDTEHDLTEITEKVLDAKQQFIQFTIKQGWFPYLEDAEKSWEECMSAFDGKLLLLCKKVGIMAISSHPQTIPTARKKFKEITGCYPP